MPRDPWSKLSERTPARIALGRAGLSLPTREVLALALDHARARDAVHATLDLPRLEAEIGGLGLATIRVESEAMERRRYLLRPDLGRSLGAASRRKLEGLAQGHPDVAIVLGDGLSAAAVHRHAVATLAAFLEAAKGAPLTLAPVVIAEGARVALGDEIGHLLGARLSVVLIGERPGLSSPDSLGIYLTFAPRPGRTDAERNCVSNVRPEGLPPREAGRKLAWFVREALSRGLTGVALKDESRTGLVGDRAQEPALPRSSAT